MMVAFYKYQGTGNDFVVIDNRNASLALTQEQVAWLCHRRLGIGADGLMLLENKPGYDFAMIYYNADGKESTMCGNGGRCLVAFAARLGVVKEKARFWAVDGAHDAVLPSPDYVELKMQDVNDITRIADACILNTGSPHFVVFNTDVEQLNVYDAGRKIRYSDTFAAEGINVNFVERRHHQLFIRTYERGVEDETLSCGTGVTAAALVSAGERLQHYEIPVTTRGGNLLVKFDKTGPTRFRNIWLCGPATFVYRGEIAI